MGIKILTAGNNFTVSICCKSISNLVHLVCILLRDFTQWKLYNFDEEDLSADQLAVSIIQYYPYLCEHCIIIILYTSNGRIILEFKSQQYIFIKELIKNTFLPVAGIMKIGSAGPFLCANYKTSVFLFFQHPDC